MAKAKNIPLNPIAGLSYGSSQNFEKNEKYFNKSFRRKHFNRYLRKFLSDA